MVAVASKVPFSRDPKSRVELYQYGELYLTPGEIRISFKYPAW